MEIKKLLAIAIACPALLAPLSNHSIIVPAASAETVVDVRGEGVAKKAVSINVGNRAYADCLRRNLERSGLFLVKPNGSIQVTGASGAVRVSGGGKALNAATTFADDRSARMAARRLSDAMCEAYGNQKGFACDKVIFLNRGKALAKGQTKPAEICVAYPDGYDIRQLTSDRKMVVYPRWKRDGESILYIGDMKGAPQIWEMNTATGQRAVKWSLRGSPTGIAVSPDGTKAAVVSSFQGNPELYVMNMGSGSWTRLTVTPNASEGQPTWSPDGRKIAYVSNETRYPQIYVIDIATKARRRLTSRGRENFDPDWGKDGRITYITKRGAAQVAVMSAAEGDATAKLVTEQATWEHPSWSRDGRHVVANRDGSLFIIDTLEGGDKPVRMFAANGNWISPCWVK